MTRLDRVDTGGEVTEEEWAARTVGPLLAGEYAADPRDVIRKRGLPKLRGQ
jgi:hypothetical protein